MSLNDSKNQIQLLRFDDDFDGEVRLEEPMARHTFYRIGGPAFAWIQCDSIDALKQVTSICAESDMPWCVVGMGANLLVSDDGFDGVVIHLGRDFKRWDFNPRDLQFYVGCGVTFARIVQQAFHLGISGFEFGTGTPGSLGGILRMNAGRPDDSIGARVVSLRTFSPHDGVKTYRGSDIVWEYRHTSLPDDEVILDCVLQAKAGEKDEIRERMDNILAHRKEAQPLAAHCCGSVFKNPEGNSAGRLIESCGLKGKRIGGAQISPKHANFIVNDRCASAADVRALIRLAQDEVKKNYDIDLRPEVRFLGFDD